MVVVFTVKTKMAISWWHISIASMKQPWVKLDDQQENTICQDIQMSSVSLGGAFVNREETSKEHIFPLSCLYFLAQSAKLKESLTVYWLVEIG